MHEGSKMNFTVNCSDQNWESLQRKEEEHLYTTTMNSDLLRERSRTEPLWSFGVCEVEL